MEKIINENKQWIEEVWEKIERKISVVSELSKNKIPFSSPDGLHDDMSGDDQIGWWTNGFWPGLMWLMYVATKDEKYKEVAEYGEKAMDKALFNYQSLYHDVGFMWHISAGANYRLTGNPESKNRNLMAAAALASRYNTDAGFIRAWNGEKAVGWAIIDCMMNIPLLYWASEEIGDPRFKQIAMHHADKTMKHHIRPDGSLIHVVDYDINNGDFVGTPSTQGYDPEKSCWSRGQAWAIYGFILSYIHTGKQEYLDAAKKTAHYFIAAVAGDGYIPKCDFRQPDDPDIIDCSAGTIAACGFIEIAKVVPEYEKKLYIKAAFNILKAIEKEHCDWTLDKQFIVMNNTGHYHGKDIHIPLIYADYYFVEAICKLRDTDILFW